MGALVLAAATVLSPLGLGSALPGGWTVDAVREGADGSLDLVLAGPSAAVARVVVAPRREGQGAYARSAKFDLYFAGGNVPAALAPALDALASRQRANDPGEPGLAASPSTGLRTGARGPPAWLLNWMARAALAILAAAALRRRTIGPQAIDALGLFLAALAWRVAVSPVGFLHENFYAGYLLEATQAEPAAQVYGNGWFALVHDLRAVFGLAPAVIFNATLVCAALAPPALYALSWALGRDRLAALAAGALYVVWPLHVRYSRSEDMYVALTPFALAGLALLCERARGAGLRPALAGAAALALAMMIRPVEMALPLVAGISVIAVARSRAPVLRVCQAIPLPSPDGRSASPGVVASPCRTTRYGRGLAPRAARTSAVRLGPGIASQTLSPVEGFTDRGLWAALALVALLALPNLWNLIAHAGPTVFRPVVSPALAWDHLSRSTVFFDRAVTPPALALLAAGGLLYGAVRARAVAIPALLAALLFGWLYLGISLWPSAARLQLSYQPYLALLAGLGAAALLRATRGQPLLAGATAAALLVATAAPAMPFVKAQHDQQAEWEFLARAVPALPPAPIVALSGTESEPILPALTSGVLAALGHPGRVLPALEVLTGPVPPGALFYRGLSCALTAGGGPAAGPRICSAVAARHRLEPIATTRIPAAPFTGYTRYPDGARDVEIGFYRLRQLSAQDSPATSVNRRGR